MKRCNACKELKELSEYHKNPRSRDGHAYRCKVCKNASDRVARMTPEGRQQRRAWRYGHPEAVLLYAARRRAKRDGVPCTIGVEDIVIPEHCPVLGIRLVSQKERNASAPGPSPAAPSLDRITPELGYVPGNVQVISHKANAMKNSASREELLAFAKWVSNHF